jgi:hypothetical protein
LSSFLRGLREFRREELPWWVGGDLETAEKDFAAFVATKLADSNRRAETFVPTTHLLAVALEQFVGRISIHHELTTRFALKGATSATTPSASSRRASSASRSGVRSPGANRECRERASTRRFPVNVSVRPLRRHGNRVRCARALCFRGALGVSSLALGDHHAGGRRPLGAAGGCYTRARTGVKR